MVGGPRARRLARMLTPLAAVTTLVVTPLVGAGPSGAAAPQPTPPVIAPALALTGEPIVVTSTLPGRRARPALLQEKSATSVWRTIARATSDSRGRVRLPTTAHVAVLRVTAPASGGLPASSSETLTYVPREPVAGLVSATAGGSTGNARSTDASVSRDGRWVAFSSSASDLVSGDTNGVADVFLRDLRTGTTTRISVALDGSQANGSSSDPVISADGSTVLFTTLATNLVSGAATSVSHVVAYRREGPSFSLVSAGPGGIGGNGSSYGEDLSADGRYAVFSSTATDLAPSDANGPTADVFLRDLATGRTRLISHTAAGVSANGSSYEASVSADGRRVAYTTEATDLVAGNRVASTDVVWWDAASDRTRLASRGPSGAGGDEDSYAPTLDDAGRVLVFGTRAGDLTSDGVSRLPTVVVATLGAKQVVDLATVSVAADGTPVDGYPTPGQSVDGTGRFVAFESSSPLLPGPHTRAGDEVYMRRLDIGRTWRTTTTPDGRSTDDDNRILGLSAGGRYLVVGTYATDLVPLPDANGVMDVALVDLRAPAR
ncbi:hypothetical protein GCM10022215_01580 [Nocardioides fonticola]|uniref:WD40 repeat protein n=2 Tax=Nocardioides fonticola TaxID=450363 RepID=A0ABP7X9Z6_9ACTN